MQVIVNTDHTIGGHEPLAHHVEAAVIQSLRHFSVKITRVEVHLTDENGESMGTMTSGA